MAKQRTLRDVTISLIAAGIHRNQDADPMDVARVIMSETGLRRATWATFTEAERQQIVAEALQQVATA